VTTSEKRWQLGDTVVLRNTGLFVGEVWGSPHIVIEDRDDCVTLFRPEGTQWASSHLETGDYRNFEPTRMDMLRLMFPGRRYAVELYFDTGNAPPYPIFEGTGRFRGWKVNIEAPFVRTDIGFDTNDDIIDLFVRPDGSWYWTDEPELDFWVRHGGFTEEDRGRIIAAAEEAEKLISTSAWPFNHALIDWRPPAFPAIPALPDGWHLLAGADIAPSMGRRHDAWRPGRDADAILDDWAQMLQRHAQDPTTRRSRQSG
jgi:hypothetical protein